MSRPDEGLIHAWLDGELPPDEAARVEQLAATDAEWAAAVADARGLIAASSRILSALDHVPANVVPRGTAAPRVKRLPWWTKAAAAVVLMAGVGSLVWQRSGEWPVATLSSAAPSPAARVAEKEASPVPVNAPAPTPPQASVRMSTEPSVRSSAQISAAKSAEEARAAADIAERAASKAEASRAVSRAVDMAVPNADTKTAHVPMLAARGELRTTAAPPPPAPAVAGAEMPREAATNTAAASTAASAAPGGVAAFAQRTAIETARAERDRGVAGVAKTSAPVQLIAPMCYRLEGNEAQDRISVVMRVARVDGDTLRLEPAQSSPASTLRAWVVRSGGAVRGAMTADAARRGSMPVTATPVDCPAP